jgi:hypothetical protein
MPLKSYLLLLIVSICFVTCKKKELIDGGTSGGGGSNPGGGINIPSMPITSNLTGLVVDENNNPISGAGIKVNLETTATNSNGNFSFPQIVLDKHKSFVTATSPGFFPGYRVFSASAKGGNFVKIQLLKRPLAVTVNANTGGTVTVGGASIVFSANSFVNPSTGLTHTGTVNVYAKVIDPSQNSITTTLPGALIGLDSTNKNVVLQSYGMLAVEIVTTTGQKLNLADNKQATINYPIPSAYLAVAPATIPLWYVDETTGIWKQEGRATKAGNQYVGTVKHFSFWNWDVSVEQLVNLSMVIKNITQHPIANALVRINLLSTLGTPFLSVCGYTDAAGQISGFVPANANLSMELLNDCNGSIYSKPLGPFTQDTQVGTIAIDLGSNQIVFAGTVKNCTNQLLPAAQLSLFFEKKVSFLSTDSVGNFSFAFTKCIGTSYTIIAKDLSNGQVSIPYTYSTNVNTNTNLDLKACAYPTVQYQVSTWAGGSSNLYGYLDATGTAARFWGPQNICIDIDGNIYVSEKYNNRIRKISNTGVVTTLAGTGVGGFADGPVATAKFNGPSDICVAPDGTLYVMDNFRIRKISNGVVSTFAGNGTYGGQVNGPGNTATLGITAGLVIDQNNHLYFAQENIIRKVSPEGFVSHYAGFGFTYGDGPIANAAFNSISSVSIDSLNTLYVTEGGSGVIRKITAAGTVSTLAGNPILNMPGVYEGGFGAYAILGNPTAITVGKGGFVFYFQDNGDPRVRKVTPEGYVTTIAGGSGQGLINGPGLAAQFFNCNSGMAADKFGNIFIADRDNNCIRKLTPL